MPPRKPIRKSASSGATTTSATRARALGLMSALGRGRGGVRLLAPGGERRVQVLPTGVDSLDVAIGAGGYPYGRLIILHGGESCGKTTTALIGCAEVQRRGGVAIYADCEHKLDLSYAESLGVDVESLVLLYPDSIERCFKKLSKILRILRGLAVKKPKKGRFEEEPDEDDEDVPVDAEAMGDLAGFDFPIVAVLDSFQSLVAHRTFDADYDKEGYNPESGAWARALAKFCPELDELQTIMLGISQVRMDLSASSYGPKKEKVGVGKAPVHHATIVVRWTGRKKVGNLKKGGVTGELHEIFVAKNQIGIPYRVATIPIVFGEGVDKVAATMAAAQATGVLYKSGAQYALDLEGEAAGMVIRGQSGFRELAANDPDLYGRVRQEIRARMGSAKVRTVSKEEAEIETLDEA